MASAERKRRGKKEKKTELVQFYITVETIGGQEGVGGRGVAQCRDLSLGEEHFVSDTPSPIDKEGENKTRDRDVRDEGLRRGWEGGSGAPVPSVWWSSVGQLVSLLAG